jgi:hypothetical protein
MADTTPPKLTGIYLPDTVNLWQNDTLSTVAQGSAQDADSGLDRMVITFDKPLQTPSGASATLIVARATDDLFSTGLILTKAVTAPGVYSIMNIAVYDRAGNVSNYDAAALVAMGVSTTKMTVLTAPPPPPVAPKLIGLSFPTTINALTGPAPLTVSAQISFGTYTPSSVRIALDHSFKSDQGTETYMLVLGGAEDSISDGSATRTYSFLPGSMSGTYTIREVSFFYDVTGERYSTADLKALGFNTTLTAVTDNNNPQITGIVIPSTIDLTRGDANISFTAKGADAETGVKAVVVSFDRPFQSTYGSTYAIDFDGTGDSWSDGVSTMPVLIRSTTGVGAYHVTGASITDNAGNVRSYAAWELAALGVNTTVNVVTAADNAKPQLNALILGSGFTVSNTNTNAIVLVRATDFGSGVARAVITFDKSFVTAAGSANTITLEGSFLADVALDNPFRTGTGPGTYNVTSVTVYDKAGNFSTYTPPELRALGATLEVVVLPSTSGTTPPTGGSGGTGATMGTGGGHVMDLTVANVPSAAFAILRESVSTGQTALTVNSISNQMAVGLLTPQTAMQALLHVAQATTSVATLSYQFFTGKIPTEAGVDYLVSAGGGNANNLGSTYYQSFNIENRYINFAVNLGKVGEGAASFAATYGGLSLTQATKTAYGTIFGTAPTDAKVADLLSGGRDAYFAAYGQDGLNGIGTKAAMVGWLLAEAIKADVGTYAKVNDAFLMDLADGATFAVNIVGVYGKPEYALS